MVDENLHISDTVLDTLNRIPETKHGAYYSFLDKGLNYSTQIALIDRNGFSLNAGVAGDQNSTDWKVVTSLAYDFGKLKDYGFNVPVVKHIGFEPYLIAGYGGINVKAIDRSEFDFGIGFNALKINF